MFQNPAGLKKRTKESDLSRPQYLTELVNELKQAIDDNDVKNAEQVCCNLANFAYDPLNHILLLELKVDEIFDKLISKDNANETTVRNTGSTSIPNSGNLTVQRIQLHALTGLCNLNVWTQGRANRVVHAMADWLSSIGEEQQQGEGAANINERILVGMACLLCAHCERQLTITQSLERMLSTLATDERVRIDRRVQNARMLLLNKISLGDDRAAKVTDNAVQPSSFPNQK